MLPRKRKKYTSEALVLLAEQVLNGHLDVLKGDVGGTTGPHTLAVHSSRRNTAMLPLDQQQADTVHARTPGTHSGGEVVAPDAVGDPFLLAVDNVVFAVLAELSLARQVRDVGARIGFSDGQADALITIEDAGQDAVLQTLLSELDQWRASDAEATDDVPDETARATSGQLISDEHLVEQVPLLWRHGLDGVVHIIFLVCCAKQTSQVAALAHLLVNLLGDLFFLVPLGNVGLDLILDPLADLGTDGGVRFVEVRRVILLGEKPSLAVVVSERETDLRSGTMLGLRRESGRRMAPEPRPPHGS